MRESCRHLNVGNSSRIHWKEQIGGKFEAESMKWQDIYQWTGSCRPPCHRVVGMRGGDIALWMVLLRLKTSACLCITRMIITYYWCSFTRMSKDQFHGQNIQNVWKYILSRLILLCRCSLTTLFLSMKTRPLKKKIKQKITSWSSENLHGTRLNRS